jgi:type IV secretory pathway VirB10-like protein
MRLTQSKLAKLWGVSRVSVHKMTKKGMPLDSIEAAESWRDQNAEQRKIKGGKASDKANPLPDTPEATEKKAARIRQAATVEEAERYLAEVEELRNFAKENAETLWQQGLADDSRKWLTVHQAIAKQYPSLHSQVLKLREAHKITITTQAAQSTFTGFLARLRGLIDSMPGALAAKVNPSDPDHAREQLERWRDESLFKTLSTAPSVLP